MSLIPIDDAVACLWPASSTDKRQRIRIEPAPLSHDRRARLSAIGGYCTSLNPGGQKTCHVFFAEIGRAHGWADDVEVRREFSKVACEFGASMRATRKHLGEGE